MDNKNKIIIKENDLVTKYAIKIFGVGLLVSIFFVAGVFLGRLTGDSDGLFGFGDDSDTVKIQTDKQTVPEKEVDFSGDVNADNVEAENIDFDLYWEVWSDMETRYVDAERVNEEEMFYDSIKGFVDSYDDPATYFLTPEETADFNSGLSGVEFAGIGAELGYNEDGYIIIVSPLKGSPALEAGVKSGDLIVEVDGETIDDESIYDVVGLIRGEKGTDVNLGVLRDGERLDITINRDDIEIPSITYEELDNGVGYVEIARFTEADPSIWNDKWDDVADQIEDQDNKKVILDLRGNPGGYMSSAIHAADDFVVEGDNILIQEDRQGIQEITKAKEDPRFDDYEIVILVNSGSASASEIFTGALQLNGIGTVIGEETYGKGTAQQILNYDDGSSVHITVYKWLLPDGTWLNRENVIQPDEVVELTDEDFEKGADPQLERAKEILNN